MKNTASKMKSMGLITILALSTTSAWVQSGGRYTLGWNTVDGGGGNCAGGKLSLSGTVGQPDAVLCTGGAYVQQGGFLPAFQKSVGPALRLSISGGELKSSWPTQCTGFHLEGAPVVTGPWTDLGLGTVNGVVREVTPPSGISFLRLRKDCPK